ncbi:two-component regulator propeller domain-containing protein [Kaistella sp. PBT33-4]|uniref:sensor histidine kinase n=1 Tax=Kaistella sp. PBT33-4 TaxID=3032000 RepID=UPI0023D7D917|nr:two-component regulator propeller domain-containing protein [Kaistella sp. PBT33-4]MDF0720308.1 two-component regulator propeller domain-containing protein [Kaistella sp. PBT33-4]
MQSGNIATLTNKLSERQLFVAVMLVLFMLWPPLFHAQYASVIENITENEGLPTNYIFNITEDHNGFLWFGTDKGLVKYSNGKFLIYDAENGGLPGNYIHHVLPDQKSGIFVWASGKDLAFFNTERNRVTHRYRHIGKKGLIYGLFPSDVNPDFIICSSESEDFIYAVSRNDLTKIYKILPAYIRQNGGSKKYFAVVKGQELLVATDRFRTEKAPAVQKGITYRVLFGTGIIRSINDKVLDTINERNGLESHMLTDIHQTAEGHLYFSTLGGGFSYIRNEGQRKAYPLANGKVRSVVFSNNKYYVLSRGEVLVLDGKKIESRFEVGRDALTLFVDGNRLYAGTFNGLQVYVINNGKLNLERMFHITDGISKIFKTPDGKLVFSTYGNGLFKENGRGFKNIRLPVFNNIENVFESYGGKYFATSYESGYTEFDSAIRTARSVSRKNGLESNNINYIFSEKDTLWVGSPSGLTARVNNRQVLNLGRKKGFSGNSVKSIFRCRQGRLWVVTNKLLMEKTATGLKPFGSFGGHGGRSPYISYAKYIPEKDELVIATRLRLSVFAMSEMIPSKKVQPPSLEYIEADGRIINHFKKVELEPDNMQTVFAFRTVDKDFLDQSGLYYKLGAGGWLPFSDGNKLLLTHLNAGPHQLQIKSRNRDGYEEMYPGVIEIHVQPPFYRKWWFILLIVTMLIGLSSFLVYQYYRTKYERKLHDSRVNEEIEEERRRISRDLHDNIGAYTTSLIMRIENLEQKHGDRSGDLQEIREISYQIMSLLRQTIWVLKMRETTVENCYEGLLSYSTRYFKTVPHIELTISENIAVNRSMESSKSISVFRIVQEALHNIVKHSGADRVDIYFESTDKMSLTVKDNGTGFNEREHSNGFGLSNMKARANEMGFELKVKTGPEGTEITIEEQ